MIKLVKCSFVPMAWYYKKNEIQIEVEDRGREGRTGERQGRQESSGEKTGEKPGGGRQQ